jgi:hypothetical protein
MPFARWTFRLAGIYGLLALLPHYFLEGRIGRDLPPPITHPEYFYGFVGIAVAWQIAFLLISRDPVKYRPFMIPSIIEKMTFGAGTFVLIALGRSPAAVALPAAVDLILAVFFILSYRKTALPS